MFYIEFWQMSRASESNMAMFCCDHPVILSFERLLKQTTLLIGFSSTVILHLRPVTQGALLV